MANHTRINTIIGLLRQGPQTIGSITEHFKRAISPRQIRGDIEKIKALIGVAYPDLEKTGPANRKIWYIKPDDYERNTDRLVQGVLPQVFALNRYKLIEKLTNRLINETYPVIESTHFYETEAHQRLDQRLETSIHAIDNQRKLLLLHLEGDATSTSKLIDFPHAVLPMKIIYHRGCFYLVVIADKTQQVIAFQIDQLTIEETTDTFDRLALIKLVDTDLSKRFGITQNIDDKTYDIALRFSSVTGRFVSEQFWHHNQDAKQIGDDWLITFRCGINRELVGWLFQWMGNVKIIGPPELKDLYEEQLTQMIRVANQSSDESLEYGNLFVSKK